VVLSGEGAIDVFAGPVRGDVPRSAAAATIGGTDRPEHGDLDGDGVVDLVTGEAVGYGPFAGAIDVADLPIQIGNGGFGYAAEPADLDHDGRLNVILATPTGGLMGVGVRTLHDEVEPGAEPARGGGRLRRRPRGPAGRRPRRDR
jgi:hypothetical protein